MSHFPAPAGLPTPTSSGRVPPPIPASILSHIHSSNSTAPSPTNSVVSLGNGAGQFNDTSAALGPPNGRIPPPRVTTLSLGNLDSSALPNHAQTPTSFPSPAPMGGFYTPNARAMQNASGSHPSTSGAYNSATLPAQRSGTYSAKNLPPIPTPTHANAANSIFTRPSPAPSVSSNSPSGSFPAFSPPPPESSAGRDSFRDSLRDSGRGSSSFPNLPPSSPRSSGHLYTTVMGVEPGAPVVGTLDLPMTPSDCSSTRVADASLQRPGRMSVSLLANQLGNSIRMPGSSDHTRTPSIKEESLFVQSSSPSIPDDKTADTIDAYIETLNNAHQMLQPPTSDIQFLQQELIKVHKFTSTEQFKIYAAINDKTSQHSKKLLDLYNTYQSHYNDKVKERVGVLNSLLKVMSTAQQPNREQLRHLLEESRKVDSPDLDKDLLATCEVIIREMEQKDTLINYLSKALQSKNHEQLEDSINRAAAFGLTSTETKEMSEAIKAHKQLMKKIQEKRQKELKKNKNGEIELNNYTSWNDLTSVIQNTSFFVPLASVLPLSKDYKNVSDPEPYTRGSRVVSGHLRGLDTQHPGGISDLANLGHILDSFVRVPAIVYDCLQYVRYQFAWNEEGIFRLAGNNDNIANILIRYEQQHLACVKSGGFMASEMSVLQPIYKGPYTLSQPSKIISAFTSVHDATNVMKRWFRTLQTPLIPYELYDEWLSVLQKPHLPNDVDPTLPYTELYKLSERLRHLHKLTRQLPPDNRGILYYIILYLHCISFYSDHNKMGYDNLAIVIAQNILRSENSPSVNTATSLSAAQQHAIMQQTKNVNEVISLLVKYIPYFLIDPPASS